MQYLKSLIFVLALIFLMAGCASWREQNRREDAMSKMSVEPVDPPLMPRVSAREQWESNKQPLPAITPSPSASVKTPESETRVPNIPIMKPEDFPVLVRTFQGYPLIVNFWGLECGPCVEELPHLSRIAGMYKDRGLVVVAVNSDTASRHDEVRQFISEQKFQFRVVLKAAGSDVAFHQAIDPDYSADPFTIIFDKNGKKLATIADTLNQEEWQMVAEALLAGRPFPITKPDVIRLFP